MAAHMTESPKVSVIIPCFNHGEFLPEAVASVTGGKRDDIEIIVVDDGSTDQRTRTETDKLIAEGIKVIRQKNQGLAAARNAGIAASKAEYVFPLDADDRIRPVCLDHGIRILNADSRVGVVYGDGEYFGVRTGRWRIGPFNPNQLLQWNYIACCAVYRRSIWEQNGGYDGTMPVQGLEDWDFWLGALERGWRFAYVPEVFFDYRVAKESMITRSHGFEEQVERFIAAKHAALYRKEFVQLATERDSVKASVRNLSRLLKSRFIQKFQRDGKRV